tara:strand:+ start:30 stop:470 length:441 start_codon:yes stop_codon:yes gene_type:complete
MSITPPIDISNSLTTHYTNYQNALDIMHDYFPLDGDTSNASDTYKIAERNLNTERAEIFTVESKLANSSTLVNQDVNRLNTQINQIDSSMNILETILSKFSNKALAANGELKIQQYQYNELFYSNVVLTLVTLSFIALFIKQNFKK